MKKGFLFGGPSNKTVTSSGKSKASSVASRQKPRAVEEMPVIRPKEGSGDGKDRYRMDEVQEALKATAPLLQNKGTNMLGCRNVEPAWLRIQST